MQLILHHVVQYLRRPRVCISRVRIGGENDVLVLGSLLRSLRAPLDRCVPPDDYPTSPPLPPGTLRLLFNLFSSRILFPRVFYRFTVPRAPLRAPVARTHAPILGTGRGRNKDLLDKSRIMETSRCASTTSPTATPHKIERARSGARTITGGDSARSVSGERIPIRGTSPGSPRRVDHGSIAGERQRDRTWSHLRAILSQVRAASSSCNSKHRWAEIAARRSRAIRTPRFYSDSSWPVGSQFYPHDLVP